MITYFESYTVSKKRHSRTEELIASARDAKHPQTITTFLYRQNIQPKALLFLICWNIDLTSASVDRAKNNVTDKFHKIYRIVSYELVRDKSIRIKLVEFILLSNSRQSSILFVNINNNNNYAFLTNENMRTRIWPNIFKICKLL